MATRLSTSSLPSYHFEPQATEQRLAQRLHARRPQGNFIKNSRTGGVVLKLSGQNADASLPEYGRGALVEGIIELSRTDGVQSVDVRIEGSLRLKEIAEGGTNTSSLCLDVQTLWSTASGETGPCPSSLALSLTLPTTYDDGKATYALPPTYEEHLSGVPGFYARIDYSVTATVVRRPGRVSLFGLGANTTVSTPFVYRPRSRPALPLPTSLAPNFTHPSAIFNEDWASHPAKIKSKSPRGDDITATLYLPSSHVFSLTEPIPFHLFTTSSAFSLANFLPFAPSSSPHITPPSASDGPPSFSNGNTPIPEVKPGATRIQLLRQTAVDVRSIAKRAPLVKGNNTDIWKTVQVGEGAFRRYGGTTDGVEGGGQDWVAWYGEVRVDPEVKVSGFKASGLNVKDYIVLTMNPSDPGKAPFSDLRLVVPIKLTTDAWSADEFGAELGMHIAGYSDGSEPELNDTDTATLTGAPELVYD